MPIVAVGQLTISDVNDGLNLVLSNESHNVPTDASGNSPVLTGAVSVAKVLAGGVDVSSQWSISAVASVGVAGSYTNNTYTVTALTVDVGTIDFTATKAGSDNLTARFTVTKSKKGDLGDPGLNGLTIVVSNESHTVPANSAGVVSSYANSGTTIRVYEGSVELNALSSATSNGSFTIGTPTQLPASTIAVGAQSYSGKIATVAVHSAMVAGTDSVVITYPITIRRANGETVSTTKAQTITKSKQGNDGAPGGPGGTGPTGPRGSVHLFRLITGSVWSDAEANLLFASGQTHHPVRVADRVTLYNNNAGFSQTRAWTGSAWELQTEVLDGNLLVTKSVTAAAINTENLYAQNSEITGSLRVGNTSNYVQLGGDTFIRAQAGSEVLFSVPKSGRGLLQGGGLVPGSVLPDALSSATIQRIRDELGGLVPEFGGTQSRSSLLASGTYALTAINSDNTNVEVSFFHLGADTLSANPDAPTVNLAIRRGSTTIRTQTFTGESIAAYISMGTQIYRNILPVIDLKINDATPGTGSIVYSVVVTVNNYSGSNVGNFNFVIIQSASGGEVAAKWSKITDKPDTATRWPTFAEVTGTAAAAQVPSLPASKITSGTFDTARIPTGISITGNAANATRLQSDRTINRTIFNGTQNVELTEWFHSNRDFVNGTLVTTSINYQVTNGDPWVLEVRGNSYSGEASFDLQAHGYIYADTIINIGGIISGYNMSGIVALNLEGKLCFWWPRYQYWQGFNVRVYRAYATHGVNLVESITDVVDPTGTKRITISDKLRVSLRNDNFNSYAPTLGGTGATGTWGINVTGSAGSATTLQTARTINGTSFNGSANIVTTNWGTARTLTIGSTGKSVNGAGDVSWTLAEIGAAAASHTHTVSQITAAGTASPVTFLRGDGVWAAPEVNISTTVRTLSSSNNQFGDIILHTDGSIGITQEVKSNPSGAIFTFGVNSVAWSKLTGIPLQATRWPGFNEVSGIATAGQIPVLDASKITTGTFATARIPTNINISGSAGSAGSTTNLLSSGVSDVTNNALHYFQTSGNTDLNPTTDWYNTIRMGHGNPVSYFSSTLAVKMTGTDVGSLWSRTISNGSILPWRRFYADDYHPEADRWTNNIAITIGSTTRNVNGSANVAWSLADIGLGNVQNVGLNWSWGTANPTHFWGSQGDSTQSYVYAPATVMNTIGANRTITSGDGLTGGNTLAQNITLAVDSTVMRNNSWQRITKAAHAANTDNYHLELFSPDSGSAQEVSLRMHQGGRFYGQIRMRGDGFHFTQGNSGAYLDVYGLNFRGSFLGNGAGITNVNALSVSGYGVAEGATGNTLAIRDGAADISARLFRSNFQNQSDISGGMAFRNSTTDNYIRFCSDQGAIRTWLNVPNTAGLNASGTWGINITGNAATVTNGLYTTGGQTVTGSMTIKPNANSLLSLSTDTSSATTNTLHMGYSAAYGFKLLHESNASSSWAGTLRIQRASGNGSWANSLTIDNAGGLSIHDNVLRLRSDTDGNHLLRYTTEVDGPELMGNSGGRLISSNGVAGLRWYSNGDVQFGRGITLLSLGSNFINGHRNDGTGGIEFSTVGSVSSFHRWVSMRTPTGGWSQGILGEALFFNWSSNANIDSNNNSVFHVFRIDNGGDAIIARNTYSQRFYSTSSLRYKNIERRAEVNESVELVKRVGRRKVALGSYHGQKELNRWLIAEELILDVPEVVKADKEGRPDRVDYDQLIPDLYVALANALERLEKLERLQ